MKTKLFGGVLLIIGTSVGGGMLALPVATAAGGFFHSTLLLLGAWFVMTWGALLLVEVNLWFPEGSNLISMARGTLGRAGELITWLAYLFLFYSLIAAYLAGGSDLLHTFLLRMHIDTSTWLSSLLFILVFGTMVSQGVSVVDWSNRFLMSTKLIVYFFLVSLIMPHIEYKRLEGGNYNLLASALVVVITSFGYGSIIPTLRSYFKSDAKSLKKAILIGSSISLLIYLIWNAAIQGNLNAEGIGGLVGMAHSGHAAGELTEALSIQLHNHWISLFVYAFSSICVVTSFLGVSLGLVDFLSDGLRLKKSTQNKPLLMLLSSGPPLLTILFYPGAFILGLNYAGIFCIILLMLMPALMVYRGRYVKKIAHGIQWPGGRFSVLIELFAALVLLIYGIIQLL